MTATSRSGLDVAILADLAQAGLEATDLVSLRKTGVRYPEAATQVLVDWLDRTMDDPSLQEKLVRALSVPWARSSALPPLLHLFTVAPGGTPPAESRRWATGNALNVLATESVFDQMAALALDRDLGPSRQMVVSWLGGVKKHRDQAVDILLTLIQDEDVDGHAVDALSRLRDPRSLDALRTMTDDSRGWVRSKARKTVQRLEGESGSPDSRGSRGGS